MIDPSSADHSVATLNGNGVCLLALLATNAIDQSWVSSARSMHSERQQRADGDHPHVGAAGDEQLRAAAREPDAEGHDATERRDEAEDDPRRTEGSVHLYLRSVRGHAVGVLFLVVRRVLDEDAVAVEERAALVPMAFEHDRDARP